MANPILSSGVFANLPIEIMEEVLLRLPVRSILRFSCVCKSWRTLISSKRFIEAHLTISREDVTFARRSVVFVDDSGSSIKHCSLLSLLSRFVTETIGFDIPMKVILKIEIVGSCNGLVCIAISSTIFCLWNPYMRKFKKLAILDCELKRGFQVINYGFGFDEVNEDYKVVCVMKRNWISRLREELGIEEISTRPEIIRVYSLKSNSWKPIRFPEEYFPTWSFGGKFVSGKLHWVWSSSWHDEKEIVSFDLTTEEWKMVKFPTFCKGRCPSLTTIEILGGCLSLVCNSSKTGIALWVMKQYGKTESWNRVLNIPYLNGFSMQRCIGELCVESKGRILALGDENFMIYDSKENLFESVEIVNSNIILEADICIESLVQLD